VLTSSVKVRISLTGDEMKKITNSAYNAGGDLRNYLTEKSTEALAKADMDGSYNTSKLIQYNTAQGINNTTYAAPYCKAFQFNFPNGQQGYLGSCGQLYTIFQNITEINNCMTACNGILIQNTWYWTSTYALLASNGLHCIWGINPYNRALYYSYGHYQEGDASTSYRVRPIANYS